MNDGNISSKSSSVSVSSHYNAPRNMMTFPSVARECCDKYGVSNAARAAIATVAVTDCGIIKDYDKIAVIDRAKKRETSKHLIS